MECIGNLIFMKQKDDSIFIYKRIEYKIQKVAEIKLGIFSMFPYNNVFKTSVTYLLTKDELKAIMEFM